MTTWTLILILAAGSNAATTITINDIQTLAECNRVKQMILQSEIGEEYRFSRKTSQCFEVKK